MVVTVLVSVLGVLLRGTSAFVTGSLQRTQFARIQRSQPLQRLHRLALASEGSATAGVRVGVLYVTGSTQDFKTAFERLNVTNETYFQTEVPDAFQFPLAAKLLAMSNTVDVVLASHGQLGEEKGEILRGYMTVSLTTNVPIIPFDGQGDLAKAADTAVQMAEIRQQALMGGGPRKSIFFGIGLEKNETKGTGEKKGKVYF